MVRPSAGLLMARAKRMIPAHPGLSCSDLIRAPGGCGSSGQARGRQLREPNVGAVEQGTHTLASALYFLVTPDRQMKLHRLRSEQIYHHYLGDSLEVLLLLPDGSGALAVVGSDLAAGMRPQLLIPGGAWHVSRLKAGGSYALLGTTEFPGFDPSDLEIGDVAALMRAYPDFRAEIVAFTATG